MRFCDDELPPLAVLRGLAQRAAANASSVNVGAPLAPALAAARNTSVHCAVAPGVQGALLQLGEAMSEAAASRTSERAFVSLSHAASVTACAARVRRDVAQTAAASMLEAMGTEFAMTIIKTIAIPLIMSFLTPFILSFVMHLMPVIHSKMTPKIVDGCTQPLIRALSVDIEMNIGIKASNLLEPRLHEKLGMLLARSLAFHLPRVLGREVPPRLAQLVLRFVAPRAAKTVAHKLVHVVTHALTHSIAMELGRVVVSGVGKALAHHLVHYYYCVYCYTRGDYCHFCQSYNQFSRLGRQVGGLGRYAQTESSTL